MTRPRDAGNTDGDASRDGASAAGRGLDDPDLSRRRRELGLRLAERRAREPAADDGDRGKPPGFAKALRLASDFVAGVILGVALGWGFDRLFDTSPWGLIVFLPLGFAAGILGVLRSAGLMTQGPAGPDDIGDRR